MESEVTVLLAAYKGSTYAPSQIESILAQDCGGWRLVLSDDGDWTAEVLDRYAAAYPDRIVRYRAGARFGSAQKHFMALLRAFRESPYIMFCDQDDIWHPDKIRRTLALMKQTEASAGAGAPVLVHTDLRVVDAKLQEMAPSFTRYSRLDGSALSLNRLLVQNTVTGCTVMINRALAEMALQAEDVPEMQMHDWWMALTAAAFGKAAFLPEATMDYRQHGSNTVGAKNPNSLSYVMDKIRAGGARKALEDTAAQAGAFLRIYGPQLSEAQKEMLEAFSSAPERGKAARLRIYGKYGFWKKDLRRRLGQLLWW